MPKVTVLTKCAKCGSEQIKHEEFAMFGRYGIGGRAYRFDAYICQECNYAELFYIQKISRV